MTMKPSSIRFVRRSLLAVLGVLSLSSAALSQERAAVAPFDFKGRLLVTVSDADMVASAYVDGRLGTAQGEDTLSVVRLNGTPDTMRAAQIPVSNSVTGPPAAVVTTPDGRYAIVVETLGPRRLDKADAKLSDLPLGKTLAVIDLTNPDKPQVVQRIACPAQPETVSLNASGALVAVTFGKQGAGKTTPLALYHFHDGRLSDAMIPNIPAWVVGHELKDATFSPQDDTLALLDETAQAVSFVKVTEDATNKETRLTQWGNTVRVGKGSFLVRFTPDGRYALVNTSSPEADTLDEPYSAQRGTVWSIRLAADRAPDGSPRHGIVSRATTGVIPEGLAVSPDGQWVATSNLEHSYMPFDDPRQGFYSSITLMRLDPRTGILERVGDFPFDGILSETVLFDNDSRFLATTTFDHFDGKQPSGSINFWRLVTDQDDPQRVELVRLNDSVPLPRGAHTMVIVR